MVVCAMAYGGDSTHHDKPGGHGHDEHLQPPHHGTPPHHVVGKPPLPVHTPHHGEVPPHKASSGLHTHTS